jgi:uncharacterized membrane protein
MIRTVLLAASVLACTSSSSSTGITAADLSCPSDSTLSYANFGSAFLTDHCLSCHASGQQPSLATQAAVQAVRATIISVAVTSSAMPPGGSVSVDERELLGEWLTCGAP